MVQIKPEAVQELLRQVCCPGCARDIVALGFVRTASVEGSCVRVEFQTKAQNLVRTLAVEESIRKVLRKAYFEKIELKPAPADADAPTVGPSMNPERYEPNEYGNDLRLHGRSVERRR